MMIKKLSSHIGRKTLSSVEIRNRFIEFFKNKNHCLIRSSSVQPYADSTLEFVNAGMNQFKNAFLGLVDPPVKRAVNSQKCIRVGGKHNDLNVVGHDSYHHTFFEMLGNWSFGDYFKDEACCYALELITSPPYSLPMERLYFTYFQGDKNLNLPPDLGTKAIWLKLGVKEDRILGFGLDDNFWEMGATGPCGPCTEIHYDHLGSSPRPQLVNKNLADLTELWNIVFIQFKRLEDGSLEELSESFVDTGMGLERLTALLQGSSSNYDSDLFFPLFQTIAKVAKVPCYRGMFGEDDTNQLDTRCRILADHSRMIAVALSDYILPDYSHSLRRVIRKSFLVADSLAPDLGLNLLLNTIYTSALTLNHHFPEILHNFTKIESILKDEDVLFYEIRKDTKSEWDKLVKEDGRLVALTDCQSAGLIEACKFLKTNADKNIKTLDVDDTLICYDRYGLNISLIEQLANIKGYSVDREAFNNAIQELKDKNKALLSATVPKHKSSSLDLTNTLKTDDKFKFSYSRDPNTGHYFTDKIESQVLKAWVDNTEVKIGQQLLYGSNMNILLSSTNFHSPLKSCGKPLGHMVVKGPSGKLAHFTVLEVQRVHSWIVHKGFIVPLSDCKDEGVVYEKWSAECSVSSEALVNLLRNTTTALLIDSYLKHKFSSVITLLDAQTDYFNIKFNTYGASVHVQDILRCEEMINRIDLSEELSLRVLSNEELLSNVNITLAPYLNPYLRWYQQVSSNSSSFNLSVVSALPSINNVKDLSQLCITRFQIGKRNRECTISGVTGPNIKKIMFESTYDTISALNSAENKTEVANMIKKAKGMMSANQIPIELQDTLKKTYEKLKVSKQVKMKR